MSALRAAAAAPPLAFARDVPLTPSPPLHCSPLPHSCLDPEQGTEMCLFVKDADVEKVKAALIEKRIPGFTKVMGVSKLRTKYREFCDRRALVARYAAFFADKRVLPMMPKLCGKAFFERRKQPMPVDVERGDLAAALAAVRDATWLALGQQCSAVRIGRAYMEPAAVAANVMAAIPLAVAAIPGKWRSVLSIHLRGVDTPSLPLYKSLPTVQPTGESGRGRSSLEVGAESDAGVTAGAGATKAMAKLLGAGKAAAKTGLKASVVAAEDFFGGGGAGASMDDNDDDEDEGDDDDEDNDDDVNVGAPPPRSARVMGEMKSLIAKTAAAKPTSREKKSTAVAGALALAAPAAVPAAIALSKPAPKVKTAGAPSGSAGVAAPVNVSAAGVKRSRAEASVEPARRPLKKSAVAASALEPAHVPPPASAKPLKSALKSKK